MLKPPRPRRGIALITALFGIVLIAAVISGAFFASTQEYRSGRNLLIEQRAFAVAELGLNSQIAGWNTALNIPGVLPTGSIDSTPVFVAEGDTARVRITRLNDNTYWVVSRGEANIPQPALRSARTTSAFVRLAFPDVTVRGAITTAGDITVTGSSLIDGRNTDPGLWNQCAEIGGTDLPAIFAGPNADVDYKAKNIASSPAVQFDSVAADSNTYIRYGSETWESLQKNADITIPGGSMIGEIFPVDSADVKCMESDTNWGEPHRDADAVTPCFNRFPIIYSEGDLHLNNGRGQGILLVNGSFRINGGFEFYGLIIVRDEVEKGNGNADVYGAILARNATLGTESTVNGNIDIYYSNCAVESALRGSAVLIRASERSWAQLF